ncbi:hypothetical protein [Rhodobacteraceae phage LS06-2018-MD06]|nr:hypothetical protein [Rhodobacteraceae phage LS06-2018-MD06]
MSTLRLPSALAYQWRAYSYLMQKLPYGILRWRNK